MRWGLVWIFTGVIIAVAGLTFFGTNEQIVIPIHDTYLIYDSSIFIGPSVFFLVFGVLYFTLNKILTTCGLSMYHFVGSLLGLITNIIPSVLWDFTGSQRRYYDSNNYPFHESIDNISYVVNIGLFLLLISQLFFLLNIILSIRKRRKSI